MKNRAANSHRQSVSADPSAPAVGGPAFAEFHEAGVLVRIRVQPRAARTAIEGPLGNELKIRIAAPPVDDAANDALQRFLAERLKCSRGCIRIVRGHKSRSKIVMVTGASLAVVVSALTDP